jgi:hypothetical protein
MFFQLYLMALVMALVTAGLFRAGASSFCVSNQSRIWRPPLPRP